MVKSDRELRSHTRKDYAKMVNNVNSDLEEEFGEPGLTGKNQNNNNGGEIINTEFFLSEEESSTSEVDDGVESSDEEVRLARE